MAEFKFSCSQCGQHIECDEQWAGQQIACPSCAAALVVPQFRVAAPVPAPGAVRPAKAEPKSPKRVAAWCAGIAAFIVAMYFGNKAAEKLQAGFNAKSKELADKAPEGEMVHIARVYQVLDATDPEKMQARAQARAVQAQAVWQKQMQKTMDDWKPKPDPTLTMPVLPPTWTLDVATATVPSGRINGASSGSAFQVENVQFDQTASAGVLSFQEGVGSSADHEIFIYLPPDVTSLAGRSWTITKDTKPKDALEIVKRWTLNPKYAPVQKIFTKGYALKLQFDQPTRDWQGGRIYLALPDTNRTVLAGEFSIAQPRMDLNPPIFDAMRRR